MQGGLSGHAGLASSTDAGLEAYGGRVSRIDAAPEAAPVMRCTS